MLELYTRNVCKMFVHKHAETREYVKYDKTLRVNNSRTLTIKNAKFLEYYVYMNLNIWENFQISISVPLREVKKLQLFPEPLAGDSCLSYFLNDTHMEELVKVGCF